MKARKVKNALIKKGFKQVPGDHQYFHLYDDNGNKTIAWTKISHSADEIREPLISQMAKQTQLSKNEFKQLIECTLSKEGYKQILRRKRII